VERLLVKAIGDLVALEETVRSLGRQPARLAAMRRELEGMHQQVQARRRPSQRHDRT
jgi:hypothetical protein